MAASETSSTIREVPVSIALSFRKELRACTACPLHEGTTPVPWHGDIGAEFAVIGEAPGQTEAREGRPFIGSAGVRLKYLLRKGDIDPDKVAYVNACQCWPQKEENPKTPHIDACRKWMRGQIAFLQPKYVITVGVVAFQSVRGNDAWPKLAVLHGKPLYWEDAPPPAQPSVLWPTYHPAAALRSGRYQKLIEEDLIAFRDWRNSGEVWPEQCYVCGDELHRYTGWGIGLCERHCRRQGSLFPEDGGQK